MLLNKTYIFFFFSFLFIFSTNSFGQSLKDFNDVLIPLKKGKTIKKKSGKDISERTYMGVITGKKNHIKYYVVKEFLRIQAAIVYHGHSNILFFNVKHILVAKYETYDLPYKLNQNTLYFKNFKVKIGTNLPKMLCTGPAECYDKESYINN